MWLSATYTSCHSSVYLKFEIRLKFLECINYFIPLVLCTCCSFCLKCPLPNFVFNDYALIITFPDNLMSYNTLLSYQGHSYIACLLSLSI